MCVFMLYTFNLQAYGTNTYTHIRKSHFLECIGLGADSMKVKLLEEKEQKSGLAKKKFIEEINFNS